MAARRRMGALSAPIALLLILAVASDASAATWSPTRRITGSGHASVSPGGLAVGPWSTAHLVFEQLVLGSWVTYYRRSTDTGTTWSAPIQLSTPGVGAAGVASISASGSMVDGVWLEGDAIVAGTDSSVVYRHSSDGGLTWGDPIHLSPGLESAGVPRVARYFNIVAVTWTDAYSGRVYIRRSGDNGATWAARVLLATTSMKPFGGSIYEAYPMPAYGTSRLYVVYMTATRTVKVRRSTNLGGSWQPAQTLSTTAQSSPPSIATNGSTALIGYGVRSSTDAWTVYRRTINRGYTWGSAKSLSPKTSYPSFAPVLDFAAGRFRAAFERCRSNSCSTSAVYYRQSTTGLTWSTSSKVSSSARAYSYPADVAKGPRILVLFGDSGSGAGDVFVRQGS